MVNVASNCGFTASNYKDLVELHKRYEGKDFEILAFPCNQFGGQEPGSNEQIKEFTRRYGVEFPVTEKVVMKLFLLLSLSSFRVDWFSLPFKCLTTLSQLFFSSLLSSLLKKLDWQVDVNGPNTHPFFKYLKEKGPKSFLGNDAKWNFEKFLVDKNGNVVNRYFSTTSPLDIVRDIDKHL